MIGNIILWVLGGTCIILIGIIIFFIFFYIKPLKKVGGDVLLKCVKKGVPLFILDTGKHYVFRASDTYDKGVGVSNEGEYEGFCPPHSLKPNQYGLMIGFGDAERGIMLPSEVIKFINMLKKRDMTKEQINEAIEETLSKDYTQEQFDNVFFGKESRFFGKNSPKIAIDVKALKEHLKDKVKPQLIDIGVVKEFFRWGVSKTLQTLKLRDTAEKVAYMKYDTNQSLQKWVPIMMGIGVLVIILVIAYIMFAQYTDYSGSLKTIGDLQSQLAICKANLISGASSGGTIHG